jgi:hypothetical protein
MPMPKPKVGEGESEFVSRCMKKLVGEEGYEQAQAAAICYNQYNMEAYSRKREKRVSRLRQLIERRNKNLGCK